MTQITTVGLTGIGTCCCHSGCVSYVTTFITGATTVLTNGSVTCNYSTIGIASCGHPTVVITKSSTVFAENLGVHRLNDIGTNCGIYTVVTNSPDVFANIVDGG